MYQIVLKRLFHNHRCPKCSELWQITGSQIDFVTQDDLCPRCDKFKYDKEALNTYVLKHH